MNGHQMQVLVDGEWRDLSAQATKFEFGDRDDSLDETTPMSTSWSMTAQLGPEQSQELLDYLIEQARRDREERARRRLWLRFPYQAARP